MFINDDKAFMEPHNDIISTALVVIGFVVFAAIVSKAYITFDDNSFAMENYRQASMIAKDIADYPEIQGSRTDLISAESLDRICMPVIDQEMHELFFQRFSGNLDFYVEITTNDGKHQWIIERSGSGSKQRDIIAASVPVVIELGSSTSCVPGTLSVRMWKNRWI
ncbi:hypothetical protein CUN85_03515 [Methanolobus halotolerans]|uniref:Uncharacterized protein n=1 Tax=Methanolobus halotolerans TaxID=2052935 RepID=A0A4E0QBM0_9EURY|nr:hypothetical protein CUN85_03515 [Methanolobus halotolerans]